jgi:hypothetical protein
MLGMDDEAGIHALGLISDRALDPGEQDRFAHDDFVDQLEALVRSGIDTANIALYGSWGAGKSSISRRLAARFNTTEKSEQFRFVELNAFKYADTPLLRTFIYRIAEATVPNRLEHYRHELYEHATKSTFKAPKGWSSAVKLAATIVGSLVAAAVAVLLLLPGGSTYHTAVDVLRAIAPSALIVGVLVTIGAHVLPYFTTENETLAPASPEEFEQLFRDLVRLDLGINGRDNKRLVVFIDELDRCSPGEVARTLETLRTFVNIPGCIFIVAADQQVLEFALTQHVRQSTPANAINPYYSAGSAYLDKIFEYQLSLPSLLPSRLVDFAGALVAGVGGVWAQLDALDSVLSVLIPVHVRSPRRVKVLLNRFAMSYAVAKKRSEAGTLDANLTDRATELAKLVCIRAEFPLFAAELERDARIVDVIAVCLQRDEDEDPGPANERLSGFEPGLRARAEEVARGTFAVDQLLSKDEEQRPEDELAENDGETTPEDGETVRHAHAAQLVDYLRQTQLVPGPRQDLVDLESIGATFGANAGFAMDLESAALANQTRRVLELITLADEDERPRGLLVLAALVKRSRGLDARNVMHSLLRACDAAGDPIEDIAPTLIRQLEESGSVVTSAELGGALRLAILGGSKRLTNELIARPELFQSETARRCVIELSPRLQMHRERLGSLAGYETESDAGALAAILQPMSEADAVNVVAAAAEDLEERLTQAAKEAEQETEPPEDSAGSARLDALLKSIHELAKALAGGGHEEAAEHVLLALVNPVAAPVVTLLDELQDELRPIESEPVVRALANDLPRRSPSSWAGLRGKLDDESFRAVTSAELQDKLASRWWRDWEKASEAAPAMESALQTIAEVHTTQPTLALAKLEGDVAAGLAPPFTTEDVDSLEHRSQCAWWLIDAGLIEAAPPCALIIARGGEIALGALPETISPTDQSERLAAAVMRSVDASDDASLAECATAIRDSSWLASPWRELVAVLLAGALPSAHRDAAPTAEALAALSSEYGRPADAVIVAWLKGFDPGVEEVLTVLGPWISGGCPAAIREAVRAYVAELDRQRLTDIASRLTEGALKKHPSRDLLADVNYQDADEATVGADIAKLASGVSNKDARVVVFDLWEALKPVDAAVRRALINKVMVPFASQSQGAYELVRSRLKLAVDPPHGTKEHLVDALIAAAPDDKRRKQMEHRMDELGLRKRRRKRFGLF